MTKQAKSKVDAALSHERASFEQGCKAHAERLVELQAEKDTARRVIKTALEKLCVPMFCLGERVMVNDLSHSEIQHPGIIKALNADGTYHVHCDSMPDHTNYPYQRTKIFTYENKNKNYPDNLQQLLRLLEVRNLPFDVFSYMFSFFFLC